MCHHVRPSSTGVIVILKHFSFCQTSMPQLASNRATVLDTTFVSQFQSWFQDCSSPVFLSYHPVNLSHRPSGPLKLQSVCVKRPCALCCLLGLKRALWSASTVDPPCCGLLNPLPYQWTLCWFPWQCVSFLIKPDLLIFKAIMPLQDWNNQHGTRFSAVHSEIKGAKHRCCRYAANDSWQETCEGLPIMKFNPKAECNIADVVLRSETCAVLYNNKAAHIYMFHEGRCSQRQSHNQLSFTECFSLLWFFSTVFPATHKGSNKPAL